VDLAISLQDLRAQATAHRWLAASLASAGDHREALIHIQHGLAAAVTTHLPLAAARLRLTLAEIRAAEDPHHARRVVTRVIARGYPPLLQAVANAVLSRIDRTDL